MLCPGAKVVCGTRKSADGVRRLEQFLPLPLPSSEMVGNSLNLSLNILTYKTEMNILALLTAFFNYKCKIMSRCFVKCNISDTKVKNLLWQATVDTVEMTVGSGDQTT